MRGMEEEIVGPLQEENKALEAELDNYRALYQQNFKDLLKLSSIIRLPRLTYAFQQAVMRKEDALLRKRIEQESINHMSNFIDEKNEEKFFDSFVQNLNQSVLIQKKGVMKIPERPKKVNITVEPNLVISE